MRCLPTTAALLLFCLACAAQPAPPPVTTGTLLAEMPDLERLARWPTPAYRTVQFSSTDRRTTTSEAPGWFANADGFGREPIPGFLKVLREPKDQQPGLFLVAEVNGPGAIVRGWSAGMGGVFRVVLDPDSAGNGRVVWEGTGYDFLARRSAAFLKQAGLSLDAQDAFTQEDADYFPVPFARGLRITWEGRLDELHFYHVQVRLYPAGTAVQSFDPSTDIKTFEPQLRAAVQGLTQPTPGDAGEPVRFEAALEPGRNWVWAPEPRGPGAVREISFKLDAEPLAPALRGCLLRIAFDGSQRPQVEAPLGDFFGSGPGVNPFRSLPVTVAPDGTMTCRFVMPYEKSVRIEIINHTASAAHLHGQARLGPWNWDARSLTFRAKWRADHDLLAGAGTIDLPYLLAIGQGVFAGCAAMIMNPSGVPTAGGNWWGEGDEKFFVDGEATPSTLGTGSEDYFNYAWSRPDLFAHPYCGQPLDSGPDTAGYVSNHRFQIMDAIPFERSFAGALELWSHNRTPGLSYARIVYHYARPGTFDDHRGLMPSDLKVPALPKRTPVAAGGASGALFLFPDQLAASASGGPTAMADSPVATQLRVLRWQAAAGDRLKLNLALDKAGRTAIRLVAVHRPDGATVKCSLDGEPRRFEGDREVWPLKSAHVARTLNVPLQPIEAKAGPHELVLEAVEPGLVELDYLWIQTR